MTINEYIVANPNRKAMLSKDGLYFFWGMLLPFLKGAKESLENIMKAEGLTVGEELADGDASNTVVFTLNADELDEWIATTTHNIPEEVV